MYHALNKSKMKTNITLLLILVLGFNNYSLASTYKVGSTREYKSPNALYLANVLQDGDTIEIDAETYTGIPSLAVWQKNDLLIKGIGGLVKLDADGQSIWSKAIWVLAGNNITVEGIEFFGAKVPDKNGAGIRLDGTGMTVKKCFFHDNENGILTSNPNAGDILIEYSEFANNGYGDGQSHNLYIGRVNTLTFRFNYSHHTIIGHNIKSRANENYILYNRIMDEESGNSSRLIDLSYGGFSIVMGNLLMQGNNAPNNNMVGYGLEGLLNSSSEFYFVNNTLVNKRVASCRFLDIHQETSIAKISNNIFTGIGEIYTGTVTELTNNLVDSSIINVNFKDELNYEYDLNLNSPAINTGSALFSVNGYSLTPEFVYVHPTNSKVRTTTNNIIDVGAYEYQETLSNEDILNTNFLIYPNPVSEVLNIRIQASQINKILIFDALGKMVSTSSNSNLVDLSSLSNGLYFIKINTNNRKTTVRKIIKH